jgi:hypothetical protein
MKDFMISSKPTSTKSTVVPSTHVSGDASHDELLLASGLDCISEFGIVPRVHLAVTADDRRVRVHLENLPRKRAVGA